MVNDTKLSKKLQLYKGMVNYTNWLYKIQIIQRGTKIQ